MDQRSNPRVCITKKISCSAIIDNENMNTSSTYGFPSVFRVKWSTNYRVGVDLYLFFFSIKQLKLNCHWNRAVCETSLPTHGIWLFIHNQIMEKWATFTDMNKGHSLSSAAMIDHCYRNYHTRYTLILQFPQCVFQIIVGIDFSTTMQFGNTQSSICGRCQLPSFTSWPATPSPDQGPVSI